MSCITIASLSLSPIHPLSFLYILSLLPPVAALPLYSVTRAFCKDLLHDTFAALLLPNASKEGSNDPRGKEPAPNTFKYILNLAKEANSSLLARHSHVKSLNTAAGSSDSGSCGTVLCNVTCLLICYIATVFCCVIVFFCGLVFVHSEPVAANTMLHSVTGVDLLQVSL